MAEAAARTRRESHYMFAGKGGNYLLVSPDYRGELPASGYGGDRRPAAADQGARESAANLSEVDGLARPGD
jgi:hypothetical protein